MFFQVAGIASALGGCGGSSPRSTSALTVIWANSKVASGAGVTLEALVTSGKTIAGTVTLYDGGTALGSPATITNGSETLSTTALPV